ncbi:MAG TPA: transposase [Sedimentisphaerales bacterium]|nr:transposase [Sedimentisphaerales bacterium]
MSDKRTKFYAEEKVKILRLHLIEKEPVSDVCDRFGLNPNVFYRWQKQFFENGAAAFGKDHDHLKDARCRSLERKISHLESRLAGRDEVIAEIMESHVQLKKKIGHD